jgi:hypothetical protein
MSFLKTLMPLLSLKRLAQEPVAPSGNVKIWIDIPFSGWTRSPKNSVPGGKFDKLDRNVAKAEGAADAVSSAFPKGKQHGCFSGYHS